VLKLSFTMQILVAMVAAVAVGLGLQFAGQGELAGRFLGPGGTIFLNLIKYIVCPLVLFSVMGGIVSMDDLKKVGVVGAKTLACFFTTSLVAVVFALFASMAVKGVFPLLKSAAGAAPAAPPSTTVADMLIGIFPSNFAKPFMDANMLQIIVMAILFGIAIILIGGENGKRLEQGVRLMDGLCVKTLEVIMKLSPIGVFCLMCPVVAANGATVIGSLAAVVAVAYGCYAFHLLVIDTLCVKLFAGVSPREFLSKMSPAILFAFSSSSSVGSLPINMRCAESLGVPRSLASFVLPLGATINMNGTVIYHGVSAVFIAACYGISLSVEQMVAIAVTSTLASIGTAGVPGAGVVMLAMVLSAAGLPLDGIALVAGVDRIFDMGRTVLNISGDTTAAVMLNGRRRAVAA